MKHLTLSTAIIGAMLAGPQALAQDLGSRSIMNKRQLAGCMIKHMRADRAISYLDAKRTCTDDLNGHGAGLAASNTPAVGVRPIAATAEPGS